MNIGFYLLNIDGNNPYQTTILRSIDELCKLRPYDNIVLFNDRTNTVHHSLGHYILHINEAKYFKGKLFVFDPESLVLTKDFPAPSKQILVINEAHWAKDKAKPYGLWKSIYESANVELVTMNKDLKSLCSICWKDPLMSISGISGEQFNNVLQEL